MRSSPLPFLGCNWRVLTWCQPEMRLLCSRKSKPRQRKKKRELWIQPLPNNSCSAPNLSAPLLFSPPRLGAVQNRCSGVIHSQYLLLFGGSGSTSTTSSAPVTAPNCLQELLCQAKGSNQKSITALCLSQGWPRQFRGERAENLARPHLSSC